MENSNVENSNVENKKYVHPIKLRDVEIKNNIFLAPMAGVTDRAFRILCKEKGAGLATSELISAKAIFYNDEKTKKLYNIKDEQNPICIQLFGSDVEPIKYATQEIDKIADIIDFNLGCPAPKIVKNGDGSKLLLDLEKIRKIARAIRENTNKPITFKIRKGWDNEHIVGLEVSKILEEEGADAITVHGRTRQEFYGGNADWDIIREIKKNVKIPVIGNGDITSPIKAKEMFDKTNCDAIMIGRASLGNPWIFKEVEDYLKMEDEKQKIKNVSLEEKYNIMIRHLKMEIEDRGEKVAVKEMRKQMSWYIKNLKDASHVREKINKIENADELIDTLKKYFDELRNAEKY